MKVLVTGGVRSGKSRHAEALLADRTEVTYVALGPTAETDPDPDWLERLSRHRTRRPPSWRTFETTNLAAALREQGPLLVDCLGTWLTALLDAGELWEETSPRVHARVDEELSRVVEALGSCDDVVLVTNEVGWGVVPSHRSGRLFRDLLGRINQEVAAACDEVRLVVSGRVLVL